MTTSRINAYRWPARLVSHKPFAAERYFITSSSIWQVFFAENYDFSFLFSLFCQWPHFLCKMHNLSTFCRWKTPPLPFAASVWAGKAGVIPNYIKEFPPSKPVGFDGGSLWYDGKVSDSSVKLPGVPAPPRGSCRVATEGFLMEKRKKR